MGDNSPKSNDSRSIGLIDEKDIVGKSVLRLWPITKIGAL